MTKINPSLVSLKTGEVSPYLHGRLDWNQYNGSFVTLDNLLPTFYGPITKRTGFKFIASVKDSAKTTRLIPFEFSTTQAYIIEAGDQYLRFYMNRGVIESAPGVPYEIVTPYLEAHINELQFTQSADVLYITHPLYAPRKLTRTAHTTWTLSLFDFLDGPYLEENTDATKTLTPSGATGNITVTAVGHTPFVSTDVGRLIRIQISGSDWGYVKITGFTSSTVVSATVVFPIAGALGPTAIWRMGSWSATTSYPAACTFHEQRLFFGGGSYFPHTVWSSRTAAFEAFSPTELDGTVDDTNGLNYTLSSGTMDALQWMLSSGNKLFIGTKGGEFSLCAKENSVLTPTNFDASKILSYGSEAILPIFIGNSVVYVQRAGVRLRNLSFNEIQETYSAPNISLLAEHLFTSPVVGMAYQKEPYSTIWCIKDNGELISCAYDVDNNMVAWNRNTVGGTNVTVESIACIPDDGTLRTELYAIVKRTINSATVQYVEYLTAEFGHTTDAEDAIFVDSALTYSGAAATVISGLDHLIGETVQVLSEGTSVADLEVSLAGTITLSQETTKAQIGLGYTAIAETPDINVMFTGGSLKGRQYKILKLFVQIYRTLALKIGTSSTILSEVPFRNAGDPLSSPPPLRSEFLEVPWGGKYDRTNRVYLKHDYPTPFTLVAVNPEVWLGEPQ